MLPATSWEWASTERQQSVNSFSCCIFGNQGIALISGFITELLTARIDKNTMYRTSNTDSKLIDIESCNACKNVSLVIENAILIRYYSHTPKTRALIESMDGPAGWPADQPPNSDGLGVYHWTVPEFTVQAHWQPGPPIWQWFRLDPDPDPKWQSGSVANTICNRWSNEPVCQLNFVISTIIFTASVATAAAWSYHCPIIWQFRPDTSYKLLGWQAGMASIFESQKHQLDDQIKVFKSWKHPCCPSASFSEWSLERTSTSNCGEGTTSA